MKKLSILFTFLFFIGITTSTVLAQCVDDCDDGVYCTNDVCEEDICVNTPNDSVCDDGISCNGIEYCDTVDDCQPGESPCEEGQVCDTEIDECVDEVPMVSVDIKPGSCPSPLNVRSRGVLPVAIIGGEGFDVGLIDPESIFIGREGFEPVAPIRFGYDDVGAPSEGDPCICEEPDDEELDEDISTADGIMDLTLKFRTQDLVEGLGLRDIESKATIPLTITMETEDGVFIGEDCVKIINNFKWWDDFLEEIIKPKKPKKPKNGDDE